MTLNKIASEIAKLEGKKSQARIGDIREILKIMVDEMVTKMETEGETFLESLMSISYAKHEKRKKK